MASKHSLILTIWLKHSRHKKGGESKDFSIPDSPDWMFFTLIAGRSTKPALRREENARAVLSFLDIHAPVHYFSYAKWDNHNRRNLHLLTAIVDIPWRNGFEFCRVKRKLYAGFFTPLEYFSKSIKQKYFKGNSSCNFKECYKTKNI